jgi:hypothetical protein
VRKARGADLAPAQSNTAERSSNVRLSRVETGKSACRWHQQRTWTVCTMVRVLQLGPQSSKALRSPCSSWATQLCIKQVNPS